MIDLLDVDGVAAIVPGRKCSATFTDISVTIRLGSSKVSIVALAPGMWDAAEGLRPCNRVRATLQFDVPECARPTNPGGIDELRIARLAAADGMRTHISPYHRRALLGEPTVGFAAVLALDPDKSLIMRRAFRTLADLGLVTLTVGVDGRHAAAWTDRAYLPTGKGVAA